MAPISSFFWEGFPSKLNQPKKGALFFGREPTGHLVGIALKSGAIFVRSAGQPRGNPPFPVLRKPHVETEGYRPPGKGATQPAEAVGFEPREVGSSEQLMLSRMTEGRPGRGKHVMLGEAWGGGRGGFACIGQVHQPS